MMVRQELSRTPETETKPLFDAVLVHSYWFSQKGEGPTKLSLRSHIEDRAAALFYDEGRGAGKIVLTGGHSWGPHYPSQAQLMRDELISSKYKIPEDAIVVRTTLAGETQEPLTTDGEVAIFLQLAEEHGWTKLADIAARVHNTKILGPIGATIPLLYQRRNQEATMVGAEDFLGKNDKPRVNRLLKKLGRSKYGWSFRLQEGIKRAVLMVNPDYSLLAQQANAERVKKGDLGLPLISQVFPIDKYNK